MTNDQLLAAWKRKLPGVEPTDRELTAFALGVEVAEASSERRAIMFGDMMQRQILAMRAAVVDGHLKSPEHGLQWIVNTLDGPGNLPDLDEAHAVRVLRHQGPAEAGGAVSDYALPTYPRAPAPPKPAPGLGDDIPCSKCGSALDTGLECTECGHDMQPEVYPKQPAIDWHALGMNWALQDARTQGPGEWVMEDLARAFAAGAKTAIGFRAA